MAESFVENLRSLSENGELPNAVSRYVNKYGNFLDNLLNVLTSVVLPNRNAGTNDAEVIPKAPAFRFSEKDQIKITEEDRAQKEAAAEYYRKQGYDVTADDIVRHPGGGLSLPNYGRGVKMLKRSYKVPSFSQILEIYKGAK